MTENDVKRVVNRLMGQRRAQLSPAGGWLSGCYQSPGLEGDFLAHRS